MWLDTILHATLQKHVEIETGSESSERIMHWIVCQIFNKMLFTTALTEGAFDFVWGCFAP